MANYYRSFMPNCSSVMRPLTQSQNQVKLTWTQECEDVFVKMKELLTSAPILAYPDYDPEAGPFILTSDGSSCGAGGYLAQSQGGQERVIGYFSKGFTESQAKLAATDKELEGLRAAVKYFRLYILDRNLILRVDHKLIVELSRSKLLNARLFRIY